MVEKLISSFVTIVVVIGAILLVLGYIFQFLAEYWYIVAAIVGAVTYFKTQNTEYSAGAAIVCAVILLIVGSFFTKEEKPKPNNSQIINHEEKKEEKDTDYAKYGLKANRYMDPIGWTDGSKYGFGKITILEENDFKEDEKKYSYDGAMERFKFNRILYGGVPVGLLNSVIPAGRRLDSDDLRLGWIDIDEEISSVIGKMGEPYKIEDKNGGKVYYYGYENLKHAKNLKNANMEITVKNSRVSSIISCNSSIHTPRGVSASDRLTEGKPSTGGVRRREDVMSLYGIGYTTTNYEGMELIEYTINSKNGEPCILRFAVNKSDNYIDYISIRHKEEQAQNISGNVSKNLGKNWIKDNSNDIYMQNPSPSEGESISWSGGYVQDGEYKFANGSGTTVWKNSAGEVVQVDEGIFEHGQRQGQFKHQFFPSGNIVYSNWKNGKEI